ncbi:hypothetical protein SAMN05421827_1402 [Pedobacter terrae]|uniref:Uncharacterized protein n=1 Tax=Pedobacter terrae TaxID=405671 RepID=A0A1G8EJS4_9SPHI|nr:hypothetical protein SAMN05421827_1402 [Pedobacter terrae]
MRVKNKNMKISGLNFNKVTSKYQLIYFWKLILKKVQYSVHQINNCPIILSVFRTKNSLDQ